MESCGSVNWILHWNSEDFSWCSEKIMDIKKEYRANIKC